MAQLQANTECPLNVYVRVRPEKDTDKNIINQNQNDDKFLAVGDKGYVFDQVFGPLITQQDIYQETVKPFVQKFIKGYNCTVLTYGQTGTGKTYTMLGNTTKCFGSFEERGLISRTLSDVFEYVQNTQIDISVEISFVEIYNQKIFDLTCRQRDQNTKWTVKGAKIDPSVFRKVSMADEAIGLLNLGTRNRHVGATNMNAASSRSHSIFTIKCTIQDEKSSQVSKLNLVDLGGSESIKRTGNEGMAMQEGININQSLFALRQVLSALSKNDKLIPFRESILTTVLQDSLTLRSYNMLIACISPDLADYSETINTLRFAESTKEIKSKPEIEVIMNKFKQQNPQSFEKLNLFVYEPTPLKRKMNHTIDTPTHKRTKVNLLNKVNFSLNTPRVSKTKSMGFRNFHTDDNLLDELVDIANLSSSTVLEARVKEVKKQEDLYSPIVRKCAEVIENKLDTLITEKISSILQAKQFDKVLNSTPALVLTPESRRITTRLSSILNTVENRIHDMISRSVRKYHHEEEKENYISHKALTFAKPQNLDDTLCLPSPAKRTRLSCQKKEEPEFKIPDQTLPKKSSKVENKAPRRSMRISNIHSIVRKSQRVINTPKIYSPAAGLSLEKTPVKRGRKTKPKTPVRNHYNKILSIINNGTQQELMQLQTVGSKTASQILLHRSLHGNISSLEDLQFWSKKKIC